MTDNGRTGSKHHRLEQVITRDVRVPLSDDDPTMENGWRCIPVPPTDGGGWFILDTGRNDKTVWCRWCNDSGGDA